MSTMTIEGFATAEGTKKYSELYPSIQYQPFGAVNLLVSPAGFGSYRVDHSVTEQSDALQHALTSGINVIDTSGNYSNGGSERLIGAVVGNLIAEGRLKRESIVVISKVGYIQGFDFRASERRKLEGRPHPESVPLGDKAAHCIHPEFIEEQLTQSLERLGLKTLDAYLLHDPEEYLNWANQNGTALEQARAEFNSRLKRAFEYLETEAAKGRIRQYGISSNTFPAPSSDFNFVSLEKVRQIAFAICPENHFRVIQFPMNFYETGGATEKNQPDGKSVIEFAKEKGLAVLINRPLNAIVSGDTLRLADVEMPETQEKLEDIENCLKDLVRAEDELRHLIIPQMKIDMTQKKELDEFFSVGFSLAKYWAGFKTYHRWKEVHSQYFSPAFKCGLQSILNLKHLPDDAALWLARYSIKMNSVFGSITNYFQAFAAVQCAKVKAAVVQADAGWAEASTLSQKAVRALRSTEGITTVLVGMRRESYVDDVLAELARPVEIKNRFDSWNSLRVRGFRNRP